MNRFCPAGLPERIDTIQTASRRYI